MSVNLPCPIYTVIPLKNSRWSVKAAVPGTLYAQYQEFASKADADAWIENHRRELGLSGPIRWDSQRCGPDELHSKAPKR